MKRCSAFWRTVAVLFVLSTLSFVTLTNEVRFLAVGYPAAAVQYMNETVLPRIEEKYGIQVALETANWNNRMDKILVSVAAGTPYDVVSTGFYSSYEEGGNGLLAPLDEYLTEWVYKDDFPPAVWQAVTWQGHIYAAPQNHDIRGVAYNGILFAEAGLDPDRPPQSWDELVSYTRRLTRVSEGLVTVRGFARSSSVGGYAQELFWFMHQAGVPEMDAAQLTSNLNKPEALQALNALTAIGEAARFRETAVGTSFSQGQVAMQRHHPGLFFRAIRENPDIEQAYGLFAPRKEPHTDPVAHAFVNGLGILAASNNKDLAWQFISAMYDDDILYGFEKASEFFSGKLTIAEQLMLEQPKMRLFYEIFPYFKASVIPPPRNTAQQEVGNLVSQVLDGVIPPEEALIRSHELWTRLLQEWQEELQQGQN